MGLQSTRIKFKKALGQNFFRNETLAKKLITEPFSVSQESLIEIGPGDGFFTSLFHEHYRQIAVIEKDDSLINLLHQKFKDIKIINDDVLNVDLVEIANNSHPVVFGSLPYNLSKKIIKKFISSRLFNDMFFIIQKEVAEKYLAIRKQSLLSLTTQYYVDTKLICNINPASFIPKPKVTSSFIHMKLNDNFQKANEEKYMKLCNLVFKNPRKTLRNNLKGYIEDLTDSKFDKRAEDLTFEEMCYLVNNFSV